MTDLEIIKEKFGIITDTECYDYWYELEAEAIAAATRMSERIEGLEKIIDGYKIEDARALSFLDGTNREEIIKIASHNMVRFLDEIDRLKAELAATKPITCGECKHDSNCDIQYAAQTNIFCSLAERKEK